MNNDWLCRTSDESCTWNREIVVDPTRLTSSHGFLSVTSRSWWDSRHRWEFQPKSEILDGYWPTTKASSTPNPESNTCGPTLSSKPRLPFQASNTWVISCHRSKLSFTAQDISYQVCLKLNLCFRFILIQLIKICNRILSLLNRGQL